MKTGIEPSASQHSALRATVLTGFAGLSRLLLFKTHNKYPVYPTWLQRAKAGEVECIVVSHTLAETYAVLTTLPVKPRISPLVFQRLIDNNLQEIARIVPLTIADYWNTIQRMTVMGLSGGAIYDALIATVARRLSADKLLTLDTDAFRRVWPEGDQVISTP